MPLSKRPARAGAPVALTMAIAALLLPLHSVALADVPARALGDTLTVVMRPILPVPEIVTEGASFTIEAKASQSTTGWAAELVRGSASYALSVDASSYSPQHERWFLTVSVPYDVPEEIYDLLVTASGGVHDEVAHAVMVRQTIDTDYYFIQITDTHLPTNLYYYQSGADTDTTEMEDLHAVIDDINLINPAFVVLTGDVINEGELEDFLDKRYFTRTQRILQRFEVPVFLTAGNHDVGGWDDTPPPDGTARRNWWKFFGWRYLNDPPPADGVYTQNYAFDYGDVHFAAIEAYNNYDRWRRSIYGDDSFTDLQLDWLVNDLSTVPPSMGTVLFYHRDFQNQLNLGSLGVDGSLWGHVHYTSGDIGDHPFDLSTETVCGGERAMRLVRVSGSSVSPTEPIDAGSSGTKLRIQYDAPNNGTATEMTATVTNNQPETFEHGRIRFLMEAGSAPYEVDNGVLAQTVVDGGVATCYVNVPFPSNSTTHVTISPDPSSGIEEGREALLSLAGPARPNPARHEARISMVLARPGHVRAAVYDLSGRLVASLMDGQVTQGVTHLTWDLRDARGVAVGSGIYLYRVEALGRSVSGKVVAVR